MADNKKQKQIEEAYERGLALEKSRDFAAAAAAYRDVLTLDPADCAGVAVRLAAMGLGATPKTAPPAYIATLFDQYADVFDMILVDSLGYKVPDLLREQTGRHYPCRIFNTMLDLGCGTGLAAEAFSDISVNRVGVDLSANMIEIAHEREQYQQLFTGDICRFLREKGGQRPWDLILATDVLPYMGDLQEFFCLVASVLAPGGLFAFSSEKLEAIKPLTAQGEARGFKVGPHQRFAHSAAYIGQNLMAAGLASVHNEDIIVRQEQGEPVFGQIFLAEKL